MEEELVKLRKRETELSEEIEKVRQEILKLERKQQYDHDIDIIAELFNRYVKNKIFNSKYITKSNTEGNHDGNKLIYDHDNVYILRHGRITCQKDDTDYFIKTEIRVDGKLVYEYDY